MTRDMELIRKILIDVQARKSLTPSLLKIEGVEDVVLGRHVELLLEAGLIAGAHHRTVSKPYADVLVTDLTWEGHDFVAALENDTVWTKIKQSVSAKELAVLPLAVLKEAGVGLLKQLVFSAVGLS